MNRRVGDEIRDIWEWGRLRKVLPIVVRSLLFFPKCNEEPLGNLKHRSKVPLSSFWKTPLAAVLGVD